MLVTKVDEFTYIRVLFVAMLEYVPGKMVGAIENSNTFTPLASRVAESAV